MKQLYKLEKNQHGSMLLIAPNGGVLHTFDANVFTEIRSIRGASINLVKIMKEKALDGDVFVLTDMTKTQHNCCPECRSVNVDLKSWVSEQDGHISDPEEIEPNDAWCNDCEKHIVPDLSTESFVLYDSSKINNDIEGNIEDHE